MYTHIYLHFKKKNKLNFENGYQQGEGGNRMEKREVKEEFCECTLLFSLFLNHVMFPIITKQN